MRITVTGPNPEMVETVQVERIRELPILLVYVETSEKWPEVNYGCTDAANPRDNCETIILRKPLPEDQEENIDILEWCEVNLHADTPDERTMLEGVRAEMGLRYGPSVLWMSLAFSQNTERIAELKREENGQPGGAG